MANILLGLASCHEAFLTAPAVRALLAAGHSVRLAYLQCGSGQPDSGQPDLGLADLRSMGMPEVVEIDSYAATEQSALVAAAQFAAELVQADEKRDTKPDWILTVGSGPLAIALAQQYSEAQGVFANTLALDAGVRPAQSGMQSWASPRLAVEHMVRYCCAPNEHARAALLAEGKAKHRTAVVGSLAGAALAALPPLPPLQPTPTAKQPQQATFAWVALERDYGVRTIPGNLDGLFEGLRDAGQATGLAVRMAPTKHLDTCWLYSRHEEAGWIWPGDEQPKNQLDAVRGASLVITDSLGYQDLAAAAGIPCVALDLGGSWRSDLEATGQVVVAHMTGAIPQCAAEAVARAAEASADASTTSKADAASFDAGSSDAGQSDAGPSDTGEGIARAIEGFVRQQQLGDNHLAPSDRETIPTEGEASGRTFDHTEQKNLEAVLQAGTLNSTRGTFVHRFEQEFAQWLGSKHAIACSNGSAAVHCAIAALGLSAGDEVITTPITDMGALTPIFYEGAVPVFADVDPKTLNVTAETIAAQLTERTKAIIVTHLFGSPCDLGPILELACRHELPIIEDAAQAFGATYGSHKAGTQGLISAFSLQQGKHITTGEGGIVCTQDERLARKLFLFVNKAWGYGDAQPDHYFPALNYRMTELQGAVACGQLTKLSRVVQARRGIAAAFRGELGDLAGLHLPDDPQHGTHSYWKFAFRVDEQTVPGGAVALGSRMREQGIACAPRYVQKPAFECQLFREWQKSPVSSLPLSANPRGQQATGPLFDRSDYPGAVAGLEQVVVLPINENYSPANVQTVCTAIRSAHRELMHGN